MLPSGKMNATSPVRKNVGTFVRSVGGNVPAGVALLSAQYTQSAYVAMSQCLVVYREEGVCHEDVALSARRG